MSKSTVHMTPKGAQALFGAAVAYSLTGVLIRVMSDMWGDKAQAAARFSLVLVMLFLYSMVKKNKLSVPRNKLAYAIGLGVAFGLVVLFFTASVQKTTIANSLFTFYATTMISSFLLGTLVLKESVDKAKLVAIGFAIAGLSFYANALVAGSIGIILGILAGLSDGVSNVLRKRLNGVDRNAVLRVQYVVGSIVTIAATVLSGDQIIRNISLHGIIVTIIFSGVLIVAGNLLLYGYQHFDVNIGTVIMSTELVFASLLGYIFYKEVPAPHELIGGMLIFFGSVVGSVNFEWLRNRSAVTK